MSRAKVFVAAAMIATAVGLSFSAAASWQGTWHYYSDEGALVGGWTAGCGAADGRWGVETDNKGFTQGCRDDS